MTDKIIDEQEEVDTGELGRTLKQALATSFSFYLKAHNYHWNVEGVNFNEYHDFFEDLYKEVWKSLDGLAEQIRTIDQYVPGSFDRYKELTLIGDEINVPTAVNMVGKLADDNKKVISALNVARHAAERRLKYGIVNFLEERIMIHEKHGWKLRSIGKARD